jgi:hypothetical protein
MTSYKEYKRKKGHQVGFAPLMASDLFGCPKPQTGTVTTTPIIITTSLLLTTGRVAVIRPVKLLSIVRNSSLRAKFLKCKCWFV